MRARASLTHSSRAMQVMSYRALCFNAGTELHVPAVNQWKLKQHIPSRVGVEWALQPPHLEVLTDALSQQQIPYCYFLNGILTNTY